MKKKYAILVLLIMAAGILLMSCGAKDAVLTMGEKTVIKDYIEFTPVNIQVRPDVMYAPKGTGDGWTYSGGIEDQTYVTLIAQVKNLSKDTIKMVNLVHPLLEQSGEKYDTFECMLLSKDGTDLDKSGQLAAGEEGTVYIMMDGQYKTRGTATITLSFTSSLYSGKETYTLPCETSKIFAVTTPLEKGKTVESAGYASMTLVKAAISNRGEPSKATSNNSYNYYTSKTKKETLLDMELKVENQQKVKCKGNTLAGAMAVCDGTIVDGFVVTETADGSDMKETGTIKAGGKQNLHALINIPKSWKDKEFTVYIYFNGREYEYVQNGR